MADDLSKKTDEQLMADAASGQESYQRVSVEVARRLRVSLDMLRRSSDRYAKWMTILTAVLTILTAILTVLTGLLARKELWGTHAESIRSTEARQQSEAFKAKLRESKSPPLMRRRARTLCQPAGRCGSVLV